MDAAFRRTTFVVKDSRASAEFYSNVFGWPIWYDAMMSLNHPFPPAGRVGSPIRICLLNPSNADFGMLGFMSYEDEDPGETIDPARTRMGRGDTVLVVGAEDIDGLHEKVIAHGGRVMTPPTRWTVPTPDGSGEIALYSFNFFDPDGIYMEVNKKL